VGRLSAQELLDDLTLELDRMRAVLSHGLSPRKPGSVSRFSGPPPVHPTGCTPVQSEYAKSAYEDYVSCATKLGALYTDLAKEAFKPYQGFVARATPLK
jgi:hypothetical protein